MFAKSVGFFNQSFYISDANHKYKTVKRRNNPFYKKIVY